MTTKAKDKAETAQAIGMETLESVLAMGTQAAAEGYKNAAQFSKEQLEATKNGYEKIAAFGKGNLDAYSAASSAALSGIEAYYQEFVDYSKKTVAQNVDLMQRFSAAKTPHEMIELQFEAMNTAFSRAITEGTKLNKIAADTVAKSVQPIKERVEGTVDALVKPFFG